MKKFVKAVLYITAGCIGIGTAALILGIVLGKDSLELQKDKTVSMTENVMRYVTDIVYTGRTNEKDRNEKDQNEKDAASQDRTKLDGTNMLTVSADKVNELQVHLRHGYLQVTESSDENIYVSMKGSKEDVSVTQEQGKLVVRDERKGDNSRKDISFYLNVPKHLSFSDVQLQIEAGVLEIDTEITADRMVLDAGAGEIIAEELYADDFFSSVGTGCIDIAQGDFGRMDLNCGIGTIEMKASVSQDSQMNCGMGSIDFELDGELDAYNYAVSCGIGSIEIGDDSYSSLSSDKRIDNHAKATFTLKCGMGEIEISS